MTQLDNMIKGCLKRGKEGKRHTGLVETKPDEKLAKAHIDKSLYYLDAAVYNRDGNFTAVAVSNVFYSMYHCLLAILAKEGYESRNQKCTIALVESLIKVGKIKLDKVWLDKIAFYDANTITDTQVIALREDYQYGIKTKVDSLQINKLIEEAKEFVEVVREILI